MHKIINLSNYSNNVTTKNIGDNIYNDITQILSKHQYIEISFDGIHAITTFCAKAIFGRLYVELGSRDFFERIKISCASDDQKIIIQEGIKDYIDDNSNL